MEKVRGEKIWQRTICNFDLTMSNLSDYFISCANQFKNLMEGRMMWAEHNLFWLFLSAFFSVSFKSVVVMR